MGIDPINKISIIIRILLAVTLFQHLCPTTKLLKKEERDKTTTLLP
jgi:hypothetical protein